MLELIKVDQSFLLPLPLAQPVGEFSGFWEMCEVRITDQASAADFGFEVEESDDDFEEEENKCTDT